MIEEETLEYITYSTLVLSESLFSASAKSLVATNKHFAPGICDINFLHSGDKPFL